jgi:DNA-binding response OmpR family regulator
MRRVSSVEPSTKRFSHPRVSSGPVVVLAADDPTTGLSVLRGLHASGYEVKPVRLGLRATGDLKKGRALIREPAELVVIDASRHPSLATGFLEALRATDGIVPVIVIAGAGAEVRDEAKRLGAEVVLESPLDVSRLRSAAEALVPVLPEFDVDEERGYSFH